MPNDNQRTVMEDDIKFNPRINDLLKHARDMHGIILKEADLNYGIAANYKKEEFYTSILNFQIAVTMFQEARARQLTDENIESASGGFLPSPSADCNNSNPLPLPKKKTVEAGDNLTIPSRIEFPAVVANQDENDDIRGDLSSKDRLSTSSQSVKFPKEVNNVKDALRDKILTNTCRVNLSKDICIYPSPKSAAQKRPLSSPSGLQISLKRSRKTEQMEDIDSNVDLQSHMTPEEAINVIGSMTIGLQSSVPINCQSIRVGDYDSLMSTPSKMKVVFSDKGILFKIPHAKEETNLITCAVPSHAILSIAGHFRRRPCLPVIFITTDTKYATWIRERLGLHDNPTEVNYFCSLNGGRCQRYITFLATNFSDMDIQKIKQTYGSTLHEMEHARAKELLLQISPNHRFSNDQKPNNSNPVSGGSSRSSEYSDISESPQCRTPTTGNHSVKSAVVNNSQSEVPHVSSSSNTNLEYEMQNTPEAAIEAIESMAGSASSESIGSFARMKCRSIRVGDYKSVKEPIQVRFFDVIFSEKGILFSLPHVQEKRKTITCAVPADKILTVTVHFKSRLPVVFVKTKSKYATWIRERLGLSDKSSDTNYFCSLNGGQCQKYITFLPSKFSDFEIATMKKIYGSSLREIAFLEANEMLMQITPECQDWKSKL